MTPELEKKLLSKLPAEVVFNLEYDEKSSEEDCQYFTPTGMMKYKEEEVIHIYLSEGKEIWIITVQGLEHQGEYEIKRAAPLSRFEIYIPFPVRGSKRSELSPLGSNLIVDITFPPRCIEEVKQNEAGEVTLCGVDAYWFMHTVWRDRHVNLFLQDPDVQEMFVKRIPLEDLRRIVKEKKK